VDIGGRFNNRELYNEEYTRHDRIEYMENKMGETEFKSTIERKYSAMEKNNDYATLLRMYVTCVTDILYRLDNKMDNVTTKEQEMNEKIREENVKRIENKRKSKKQKDQTVREELEDPDAEPHIEIQVNTTEQPHLETERLKLCFKNRFSVLKPFITEIFNLREYANSQLANISKFYGTVQYAIMPNKRWLMGSYYGWFDGNDIFELISADKPFLRTPPPTVVPIRPLRIVEVETQNA
jgi:DNA polymerase II small subunit/DNA polymerase delta subunit B